MKVHKFSCLKDACIYTCLTSNKQTQMTDLRDAMKVYCKRDSLYRDLTLEALFYMLREWDLSALTTAELEFYMELLLSDLLQITYVWNPKNVEFQYDPDCLTEQMPILIREWCRRLGHKVPRNGSYHFNSNFFQHIFVTCTVSSGTQKLQYTIYEIYVSMARDQNEKDLNSWRKTLLKSVKTYFPICIRPSAFKLFGYIVPLTSNFLSRFASFLLKVSTHFSEYIMTLGITSNCRGNCRKFCRHS